MRGYLNIDELSEYLGIKKKTLYNKANRGEIPYFKFGRLVRFKKSDIDAWEIGQRKIVDADKRAKDIIRSFDKNDMMDIDVIMHKAIEETTGKKVYSNHRKVRPTKGLGEEEKDGTF